MPSPKLGTVNVPALKHTLHCASIYMF